MNFDEQLHYWTHMLDETMNDKALLNEDKEGKNINKAEKWIKANHPEVIGRRLENGTTITPRILTQEIRNTMPNARMADCKFLVGITRLYFDNQSNPEIQSIFNKLNKMLKIICIAHADEYDNDLNGLSFDELDKKFSGAVQKELDSDKDEIDKLVLIKNENYEIVPIDSFEEAEKYGKYTSWCVTHYEDMFNSYTKNGLGRFYFCLKPGFENIQKRAGEDCPMDDYGKSMIAISVNDDGSLNTCTCRWNHDNDGNDSMMDTKEISEFFGVNFYKTFVPWTAGELMKKYEKNAVEDDEIAKILAAKKCIRYKDEDEDEDEDEDTAVYYVKNVNNKIIRYDGCKLENHLIHNSKIYHVENGKLAEGISKTVTKIEKNTFKNYTSLTSVTIPSSVTSIESSAFSGCDGLTLVEIPSSVTSIGEYAFWNCISLTSMTIPSSVTSIGEHVFTNCEKLKSIIFENPNYKQLDNYPWGITDIFVFKTQQQLNEESYSNYIIDQFKYLF